MRYWYEEKAGGVRVLQAEGGVREVEEEKLGVVEWAEKRLGFRADALQRRVLESEARRGILNCSRQWGKSTVAAVKALWTAVETREALVLVMSPSKRQSGEFLRKVEGMARQVGWKGKRDGVNEMSVWLGNGSRIVGLPGVEATMRGYSAVDLLVVDEAARVADEQYWAAGAVLAVKEGAMWLLSTPFGARGFFWKEWTEGGEGWERVEARGEECERIGRGFLEEEKRRLGEAWYGQEYGCEFVGVEGGAFREEWLRAAMVEGVESVL